MTAQEFYKKNPKYIERAKRQDLVLLQFTIKSGNFSGQVMSFEKFVSFINVNRSIVENLILKQQESGFNYGKIGKISFIFK
jgi:hypothetical protein